MKDAGFRWRPLEMRRGRCDRLVPDTARLGFVGASGEETIDSRHRPSIWNLGQPAGDVFFPSFIRSAKTFLFIIFTKVYFLSSSIRPSGLGPCSFRSRNLLVSFTETHQIRTGLPSLSLFAKLMSGFFQNF